MFQNMVASLIEHERIKTTDAKAKELRRIAERTISWATSVGNLIESNKKDAEDQARIVHAMRMARRVVKQKVALHKLFHDIGPRMAGRAGGYLRVLKIGNRHGDAAPMSLVELVDRAEAAAAAAPAPAEETSTEKKGKGKKAETAEAAPKAAPKKKAAPKAEKAEAGGEKKAAPKKKATKKSEE
jgi:large subunit ribosomal protein L17